MYALGAMSVGPLEIGIVLLIVIILFGPKQLPKLGKMFGKTMTEVRSGIEEANETINPAAAEAPAAAAAPAEAAPAPKFDPQTGEPLVAAEPAPKFDPQTGEPLAPAAVAPAPVAPEQN
ncbi:MAG: twin-arginine translocase TatA/TatE family subunit [Coriobacteriia bacterium]|nr:twin-arginine translocase TatA/TatE family subunit [Coriobacteriia bacterium]